MGNSQKEFDQPASLSQKPLVTLTTYTQTHTYLHTQSYTMAYTNLMIKPFIFRENCLIMNIFFEEIATTRVIQAKAYTYNDVISKSSLCPSNLNAAVTRSHVYQSRLHRRMRKQSRPHLPEYFSRLFTIKMNSAIANNLKPIEMMKIQFLTIYPNVYECVSDYMKIHHGRFWIFYGHLANKSR